MKEKVLGIIGGMGPEATVDLMNRIIKSTVVKKDQDHIRMLVDNNPKIPCRVKALLDEGESPGPIMAEMGKNLEKAGADFLVIPCNTAHYFINDVIKKVNIPVINMIEETVNEIISKNIFNVSILASTAVIKTRLYEERLASQNIEIILPERSYQDKLMHTIFLVKSGEINKAKKNINEVINHLKDKGSYSIILGCTEFPIIVEAIDNINFLNPTQILADVILREINRYS